jgi:hypothetical protein
MKATCKFAIGTALLSAAMFPACAIADSGDSWEFGLSIYGWFPDLSGRTSFTPPQGDGEFTVEIGDILDNLKFTFQGSFDARKGNWGLFTDVIYMDLDKSKSNIKDGVIGPRDLPYEITGSASFDMKSLIWTTAAYYRMFEERSSSFDLLVGVRYADVEQSLKWQIEGDIEASPFPGPEGEAKLDGDSLDAIIGIRGRFFLGQSDKWFFPYYADIGTGDSNFTWQAAAGIGYAFNWGEIAGVWRYLDYDQPEGKPLADLNFSGPAVGAVLRW